VVCTVRGFAELVSKTAGDLVQILFRYLDYIHFRLLIFGHGAAPSLNQFEPSIHPVVILCYAGFVPEGDLRKIVSPPPALPQ
jgi:hypothetical protein